MNSFDSICQRHMIWIIKYISKKYSSALYLIWYTDTDKVSTDRFLTYKDGTIFSLLTLNNLENEIQHERFNLTYPENLRPWLADISKSKVTESVVYNTDLIVESFLRGDFSEMNLEHLTNFVNLFDDYVHQDEKNEGLKVHSEAASIREVWDYYYDFCFWPKFKMEENKIEKRKLEVDVAEFLKELTGMVEAFDRNISLKKVDG